jgi:hypothetical protein
LISKAKAEKKCIADVSVAFENVAACVNRYEIGGLGKGWDCFSVAGLMNI